MYIWMWCQNVCVLLLCIIIRGSLYVGGEHLEGKDIGEMWAAVFRNINNLLLTSVASNAGSQKWGQSWSQYMPRRGPWRTYSRDASRRPKPKYVHYSIYVHWCKEMSSTLTQAYSPEGWHSRCTLPTVHICIPPLLFITVNYCPLSRVQAVCV
jgi:hypothetical protein